MNLKKRLSAVLSVIFLFNMIGFQDVVRRERERDGYNAAGTS